MGRSLLLQGLVCIMLMFIPGVSVSVIDTSLYHQTALSLLDLLYQHSPVLWWSLLSSPVRCNLNININQIS